MPDLLKNLRPEAPPASIEVGPAEQGVESSENAIETQGEVQATEREDRGPVSQPVAAPARRAARTTAPAIQKDEVTVHIEKIMEEGLGEMYAALPDDAKREFRARGEKAASEIAVMVRTFKIRISRVLHLIRDWLMTIPKVNKFFLEQEAKIKTDRIIELAEARREDLSKQP